MANSPLRARFAPAPTGLMHLGNIRAGLMNYLFTQQKQGTFVLRIEDTDALRNYDPNATQIIDDLHWLHLSFDEGPGKGGPYAPYFQSQRTPLYLERLQELIAKNAIYRCFCTTEELEKKRLRQIALKQPPRYDRACLKLSEPETNALLEANTPFIWRFKLDQSKKVTIHDLAHGDITFDLANFSDFPLTRQDGSVTFIFSNGIDDIVMKMTHVFRGEDHLTNTAVQAALFETFNTPLPVYWHMPIICNIDGKKLSKRDFGFSLQDLKVAGFLPEAIVNYLAIIGGGSFKQEIMTLEELAQTINFDTMSSTGRVTYDVEKLRWVNHKWIDRYDPMALAQRTRPFLEKEFPAIATMDDKALAELLQQIKTDVHTLDEFDDELAFYFVAPTVSSTDLKAFVPEASLEKVFALIDAHLENINNVDAFMDGLKKAAKEQAIPFKELFTTLRMALTGKPNGPTIHILIGMIGADEAKKRFKNIL